jgi:hypothetical protein
MPLFRFLSRSKNNSQKNLKISLPTDFNHKIQVIFDTEKKEFSGMPDEWKETLTTMSNKEAAYEAIQLYNKTVNVKNKQKSMKFIKNASNEEKSDSLNEDEGIELNEDEADSSSNLSSLQNDASNSKSDLIISQINLKVMKSPSPPPPPTETSHPKYAKNLAGNNANTKNKLKRNKKNDSKMTEAEAIQIIGIEKFKFSENLHFTSN